MCVCIDGESVYHCYKLNGLNKKKKIGFFKIGFTVLGVSGNKRVDDKRKGSIVPTCSIIKPGQSNSTDLSLLNSEREIFYVEL